MDDLERLFQHLVCVLSSDNPERLAAPFQISELYQSIIPYRTHKKQLGFDTNQDYEMAVLRLLAGEEDYASVEPAEVQEQLRLETEAIDPNPGAFHEFAAARVTLSHTAVRSCRTGIEEYAPPLAQLAETDAASENWNKYAPPGEAPDQDDPQPPVFEAVETTPAEPEAEPQPKPIPLSLYQPPATPGSEEEAPPLCRHCSEVLPTGRRVVFCPFCGVPLGPATCTECGSEIEERWRFCADCGAPATGV